MKMKFTTMAAFLGGMSVMGYMYLKMHPEKVQMMKDMGKEASRKMYNMFDEDE